MPDPATPLAPARREELAALAELINTAYGRTEAEAGWTSEQGMIQGPRIDETALLELLERSDSHLLVHRRDGDPVACLHLQAQEDQAYELGLFAVDPGAQGQGIGQGVLAAAETYAAQALGAWRMVMHVISSRTELLAWYERRGYTRTGERHPIEFGGPQRSLQGPLAFEVLEKALG